MMMKIIIVKPDGEDDDDQAHPGRQKDVEPVGNRDGQVSIRLDLTIVLTTVVHLWHNVNLVIIIIGTSNIIAFRVIFKNTQSVIMAI